MDPTELAAVIDHTLLRPEASASEVEALVADGAELGVAAVCVTSAMVPVAVASAAGRVPVASVVGFPSGAHPTVAKAAEAAAVVEAGAAELDMVANLGAISMNDWATVERDVAAVRHVVGAARLKVILESALWDDDTLMSAARAAAAGGADDVKTSTGFHSSGGATLDAVRTLRTAVGADLGVKASGGIRDRAAALAMLDAGDSSRLFGDALHRRIVLRSGTNEALSGTLAEQ